MISTISELQRLNKVNIPAIFGPRFDKINIFYSSPDYYTECKYAELQTTMTSLGQSLGSTMIQNKSVHYAVKTDDFMPYSDCEHCFWTGYFTSRAGLKRLERVSSSFLLGARQIDSMLDYTGRRDRSSCPHAFHILEDASGVVQHHDGVSGTSKQHVADDYAKRLQDGINVVSMCVTRKLRRLFFGSNATDFLQDLSFCQLLNETKCDVSQVIHFVRFSLPWYWPCVPLLNAILTQKSSFVLVQDATKGDGLDLYVIVYNSLAQTRSSIIHLPVSSQAFYSVQEIGGGNHTVVQVPAIPTVHSTGGAPYRVIFQAKNVPAMGASIYKISLAQKHRTRRDGHTGAEPTSLQRERSLSKGNDTSDIVASNEFYSVIFDG